MEKIKETLELLREVNQYTERNLKNSVMESQKRYELCLKLATYFHQRVVLPAELSNLKEKLLSNLTPAKEEQASDLYKNMIAAYQNWFTDEIVFNEYFKDAWGKIFAYTSCDERICKESSLWSLEMIFYEIQKIVKKDRISVKESEFIGNFLACFPHHEDITVVRLATNYFYHFTMFYLAMCPTEISGLTALDKIELGSLWQEAALKRERVK